MPKKLRHSADNTITFVSSATELIYDRIDTHNTLYFDQLAWPSLIKRELSQDITFEQNISTNNIISQYLESELILGYGLTKIYNIYESVDSTLDLVDNAHSNIKWGVASNSLNLTHDVIDFKPIQVEAVSDLTNPIHTNNPEGLRQEVKVELILNPSIISYVNLSQSAHKTQTYSASNHIHLSHEASTTAYDDINQLLSLTQEATYNISKPVSSILNLTHNVDGDTITLKTVSSVLNLKSVASFFIVDLCNYSPGVGAGDPAPSMIDPTILRRSTTILTYPYVTPVTTVEIRNPDFDNVEQFEYRKINRRSRGGTLQIYRDDAWPEAERIIMTFSALSQQDVKDLMNFMNQSLGKEVGVLDFESRQWRGVILTPTSQTSEEGSVGFSASFEFEGTLV